MSRSKNPGFIPGDHWVTCPICEEAVRKHTMKRRWDGLWVCEKDYDPRHPQEFVRTKQDKLSPPQPVNPPPTESFVTPGTCSTRTAVAGEAIAGCAIAGWNDEEYEVPAATF
jgi:hypothetical protein